MERSNLTLRDLVTTVSEFARNDDEVLATVAHLVNSGRVHLLGDLAGARIGLTGPRGSKRPAQRSAHA
ncbi:MAG: hypothetical protein RL698_867 [Pseudomonadota bacterium]|jgi:hypothetical protein